MSYNHPKQAPIKPGASGYMTVTTRNKPHETNPTKQIRNIPHSFCNSAGVGTGSPTPVPLATWRTWKIIQPTDALVLLYSNTQT